jgi:four helix bundle protein
VRLYQILVKTVPQPIARQVLRAGTSIGANLEEARAPQSRKDLIAKFSIALKEARETSYWLRLLSATSLAQEVVLAEPLDEADQLVAILTTSVRRLRRQDREGNVLPVGQDVG